MFECLGSSSLGSPEPARKGQDDVEAENASRTKSLGIFITGKFQNEMTLFVVTLGQPNSDCQDDEIIVSPLSSFSESFSTVLLRFWLFTKG